MDSLANYGSDDDCDSGDERSTDSKKTYQEPVKNGASSPASRNYRKPSTSANSDHNDANYDEVQMDLSEDSNDSKKGRPSTPPSSCKSSRDDHRDRRRDGERDRDRRSRSRGREDYRRRDRDRSDRRRDSRERDRRDDSRSSRDNRHNRDRRERRQRSRSRDRNRRRSRSPRRSRSRSRDRRSGFKRFDRASMKMDKLDKMGIELKAPESTQSILSTATGESKPDSNQQPSGFFMPGITGKFREQIERRKLLWQKKSTPEMKEEAPQSTVAQSSGSSRSTKVWECTTFAQDTDGKVANKFKRLMGIKSTDTAAPPPEVDSDLVKKRQEEMFSSMEQQYEVARSTTHTMRGMGLGFGSYQR